MEERIKKYLYYYNERDFDINLMKYGIYSFSIFASIVTILGMISVVVEGKFTLLVICMFIDLLVILHIVIFLYFKKKDFTLDIIFLAKGISSLLASIFFMLLAFFLLATVEYNYSLLLFLCWCVAIILNFIITLRRIKMDKYNRKGKQKKNKLVEYASIGGGLGLISGRLLLSQTPKDIGVDIGVLCFFSLSIMCTIAMPYFLKYYYVKKYSIEDPNPYKEPAMKEQEKLVKKISEKKVKKILGKKTKILIRIGIAISSFFLFLFILGVIT